MHRRRHGGPAIRIPHALALFAFASSLTLVTACGESRSADAARVSPRERRFAHYELSGLRLERSGIMTTGVPKDGIPALTNPERASARDATYPPDDGRVVVVALGDDVVAYPIGILNYHEIANDEVGGVPVAVTYCPLCDSVSVLDRRLRLPAGGTFVVEFGVSGLLYNSNVVMYERETMGLWSQVDMRAVSGPHAGLELTHLPVRMMTFGEFKTRHPGGEVLTLETGHDRPYDRNPYRAYFDTSATFRGIRIGGDALPPKTLGLGVRVGDFVSFVTREAARETPVVLVTPRGDVVIRGDGAGMTVDAAPSEARIVQTYYHSWSAFHPQTEIVTAP